MIVSCVLRRGPAFDVKHVYWLGRQVAKYMPDAMFLPASDTPLDIPYIRLEKGWPSWWSKMEAFAKLPDEPVLMLDIDTVIVKGFTAWPVASNEAYMATFPNRDDKLFGGWQLSGAEFRHNVAEHFASNAEEILRETEGCDQRYYDKYWRQTVRPLRKIAPDLCCSYSWQVKPHGLFSNTAFVLFHGLPRPWQLDVPWIPKLEEVA